MFRRVPCRTEECFPSWQTIEDSWPRKTRKVTIRGTRIHRKRRRESSVGEFHPRVGTTKDPKYTALVRRASGYRNVTYSVRIPSVANEAKAINPALALNTGVETIKAGTKAMLV